MKNLIHRIGTFLIGAVAVAGAVFAQPSVLPGGIVNHFSYAAAGLPNADIAQGSIFDIYGANIGPETLTKLAGFPVPTILANTSVQVTVEGTTVDIYLFFVSKSQIAGVLPSRTPVGDGTLTVTVNGQKSVPVPIRVVARSIGILTLNQAGHGPAVMQMPDGRGGNPLNSVSRPIKPKGIGVFYGTGGGGVTFDETNGAPVGDLGPDIHALVDGKEARLLYRGRAPGFVGLDQYNVEIPAGVSGCAVPVAFRTGNVISNYTTISVVPSGACPDPPQPPITSGIDQVGAVALVRSTFENPGGSDTITDFASSAFTATDYSKITPGPPGISTTIGPCIVQPVQQQTEQPDNSDATTYLDAGAVITLSGPNGDKEIPKLVAPGFLGYSATLGGGGAIPGLPAPGPPYLSPGTYTVNNGAGGPDVGPFQSTMTIADEFVWTNKSITAVERAQGLEITWTGADPNSVVSIAGISRVPESGTQPRTASSFSCTVPGLPGRYTVPPEVLLTLPPSVVVDGVPTGALTIASFVATAVRFNATGIDYGQFSFVASFSKAVRFR